MVVAIIVGPTGSTAINPCGLTYEDVREASSMWALNRHLARCVKEIADIREVVSPVHYGPDIFFDCTWRSIKISTTGSILGGICPLYRPIMLADDWPKYRVKSEVVPGDGDWQDVLDVMRFESQDSARVYAVYSIDGRNDLVQGGLNRMKFLSGRTSCFEPKCAEKLIRETVEPYADVSFGLGSWQYNRTWWEIDTESRGFKEMRAMMTNQTLRRTDVFETKIRAFAALVEKGPPRPNASHVFAMSNTPTLRIGRSDYRTMHEWLCPYGGRMLYVMVHRGAKDVSSTLFIRPPTNIAAVLERMYI